MSKMTNHTERDLAKAGYAAVLGGELADLRDKLRMTRNAQARLIGVEGESLRQWEALARGMNIDTAIHVGEWLWGARKALGSVSEQALLELVPISTVARGIGVSAEELETACEHGQYRFERLGVLGTFIYRNQEKP